MGNFFKSLFSSPKEESPEEEKARKDRQNFEIFKYDGIRAQHSGRLDYAVKCYQEALNLAEDIETMNYLASIHTLRNELDEALEIVDRMHALEPENTDFLVMRANLNYMRENYPAVLQDCDTAIEADDTLFAAYFIRAKAKKATNDLLGAIVDISQTLSMKEDFPAAYLLRAKTLKQLNQMADALEDIDRTIQLAPEEENAYMIKGEILEQSGDADAAEKEYRYVLELNPFNENAYLHIGRMYIQNEKLDEAVSCLDEAIELNPAFANAYHERGRANYLKGDKLAAAEDMKKALELDPEGEEAKKLNGQLKNFGDMYKGGIF